MPTYGEILSKDSDGKKFMSALTNNGGANEFTAIKGANRATQNSEAVADLVVTLDGETVPVTDNGGSLTVDDGSGSLTTDQLSEYTDGATFTRSSSKLLAGLAGIYESTVSALTAGKVALARLTSRGAVVVAGDTYTIRNTGVLEVSSSLYTGFATTAPTDILGTAGGRFNGSAASAYYRLPMAEYRAATIKVYNYLGVSVDFRIYAMTNEGGSSTDVTAICPNTTIVNGTTLTALTASGTSGSGLLYVPEMATPMKWIMFTITPAAAPSGGGIEIQIARRS